MSVSNTVFEAWTIIDSHVGSLQPKTEINGITIDKYRNIIRVTYPASGAEVVYCWFNDDLAFVELLSDDGTHIQVKIDKYIRSISITSAEGESTIKVENRVFTEYGADNERTASWSTDERRRYVFGSYEAVIWDGNNDELALWIDMKPLVIDIRDIRKYLPITSDIVIDLHDMKFISKSELYRR